MSKCQHGQKITTFCATQCCVWKEAGGCNSCMKKYHNHMGPTIFVTQQQANKLVKKYNVDPSIKPKCRTLQQLIFNYFNLIKTEFDAFIDSACIDIMNQIGHPYLTQNNLFTTYKRLKKKDYKKIQQKDFKSFYETSQKLNNEQLIEKQGKIYIEKVKKKSEFINSIEKIMRSIQKANKESQQSYFTAHDGTINLRINEIVKSILKIKGEMELKQQKKKVQKAPQRINYSKHSSQSIQKISIKTHTQKSEKTQDDKVAEKFDQSTSDHKSAQKKNNLTLTKKEQIRPARINSLDKQFIKSNKLDKKRQNKEKHDTSINQSPHGHHHNYHYDSPKQTENSSRKKNKDKDVASSPRKRYFDTKQVQISQKKQKLIDMMKQKDDTPINKLRVPTIVRGDTQKSQQKLSERSAQGSDSFDQKDQITKQLHLFAHTVLPRTQSRQKIFQETQQIAQKTIIVPVDNKIQSSKIEECQSPLLKNKFKSKQLDPTKKEKKEQLHIIPKKISSQQIIEQKNEETNMNLNEKQQKSLALLIKSLSLKMQEAIPYLEKALQYSQDNLSAAQYLSYLYLQINRPKQCLNLCNKMLQKLTNSPDKGNLSIHLYINKSTALNMLGRYSQSIFVSQQCLKYKSNQKIYKNLGDAYFSIGILQKATYSYEKAVSMSDHYDQAHYNLAVCLFSQENYYNAKFSIVKALSYNPKNQDYLELQKQIIQRIKEY